MTNYCCKDLWITPLRVLRLGRWYRYALAVVLCLSCWCMAASVDAASLPVTSQPSDPLATAVAPDDALTQANQALALYQMGEVDHSLQALKQIARHYPRFPDVRAALAAALWAQGKQGEAESHWVAAVGMDQRYQDVTWVSQQRRWPPAMVTALAQFLQSQ